MRNGYTIAGSGYILQSLRGTWLLMYILLRHLRANGFIWKLGPAPLIIGRGQGCDIRVFDAELSRRHARVWLEDGFVRFEDLGSSNATLVNGQPATSGTLRAGDTLGMGTTIFLISEEAVPVQDSTPSTEDTPITLSARLGSYMSAADVDGPPLHRTIHELHDLFQLGRTLGSIETVHDLAELLEENLRAHFKPAELWIAWRYGKEQPLVFAGGREADPRGQAARLLRRAVDSHEGIVKPVLTQSREGKLLQSVMAVPLVHADQALGGFVLCGQIPLSTYAEEDLHYALGIAAIAAPHVRAVRHVEQLRRDNSLLRVRAGFGAQLLGDSQVMARVRDLLLRASTGSMPVLIQGETGTGKELAARMLHDASTRSEGPYVVVNCAAIPDHLFESEFFGHEPGAFTGALGRRQGYFEQAHGGTLFLDEVGDLSQDNQARILRAVETGTFRRVGGTKPMHVDVRVVSATNKPLDPPAFRSDLLHRIRGISVLMPPLRERPQDIAQLAEHFLQCSASHGSVPVNGIHPEALEYLQRQPWPGNVRELRSAVDRALLFATTPELRIEEFQANTAEVDRPAVHEAQPYDARNAPALVPLAEMERMHILRVFEACKGNIAETARLLKINRATLYRRLAEYGVGQTLESS